MNRSKARTSALLAGLLGVGLLIPLAPAQAATISVSITGVKVTPAFITPGHPASSVTIEATVAATFAVSRADSEITMACKKQGNTDYRLERTYTTVSAPNAGVLTVTAGGVPMTRVPDSNTWTLERTARTTDGSESFAIAASASQQGVTRSTVVKLEKYAITDTTCSGTKTEEIKSTTSTTQNDSGTASATASYTADRNAPTIDARYGNDEFVTLGGTLNINVEVGKTSPGVPNDAIPGDAYSVEILATQAGGDFTIPADIDATIGQNGSDTATVGLDIPCTTPLGLYDLSVTVKGLRTADPDEDFADQVFNFTTQFEVKTSTNLTGNTAVFAFQPDGTYAAIDESGFTATKSGGTKRTTATVNTSPGAFHVTQLMKATGGCAKSGETAFNFGLGKGTTDIELTAPEGFAFVMTGQNYAKVYAGRLPAGTLFNYEVPALEGFGTNEVSSILSTVSGWESYGYDSALNVNKVMIRLDALDTAFGGPLKQDGYVLLRARVRYVGTSVPTTGQEFTFRGRVSVDGLNGAAPVTPEPDKYSQSHSFTVVHAPTLP